MSGVIDYMTCIPLSGVPSSTHVKLESQGACINSNKKTTINTKKERPQQTYKYWANAGVILASTLCTGNGTNGIELVQWTHRDKSRCTCMYRPSIGPIVSAQHWPACIGPALARYEPVSTLFRKMSQGKIFMAPPRECNFTAKLRGLSSTRRRHFCERFGSWISSGKLQ